ncbi:protein S100-Z-like [Vanacampus margaritifer]
MCETPPTKLEVAMFTLCEVFHKYATLEGRKDTLSKAEAKLLLEKEMPRLFKAAQGNEEGEKILEALDIDKSGEMEFKEFMLAVSCLTCICQSACCSKQ